MSDSTGNKTNTYLNTKQFYNWIKEKTGKNSPTTFYWFSVVFYPHVKDKNENINVFDNDDYFQNKINDINDLRFSIQKITLPRINFSGYNNQGASGEGTLDGSNMFGTYTILGNSYLGLESKLITMNILNTGKPIIERFLYPWMISCLNHSEYVKNGVFPRLDMCIKFWRPNRIFEDSNEMESSKPDFIYFIKGIFPCKIQPYDPVQGVGNSDYREVTFSFNEFVMAADSNMTKHFGIDHIKVGGNEINEQYKNRFWSSFVTFLKNGIKDLKTKQKKLDNPSLNLRTRWKFSKFNITKI